MSGAIVPSYLINKINKLTPMAPSVSGTPLLRRWRPPFRRTANIDIY
jgi:hypothetical protein